LEVLVFICVVVSYNWLAACARARWIVPCMDCFLH
jgi:hypothetical protein